MANVDRRSALRKAPTTDVVEALTSSATETLKAPSSAPQLGPVETATADEAEDSSLVPTESASAREVDSPAPSNDSAVERPPARIGPGRPRGKRRMEQFSSKIEIQLRDDLDAYLVETGTTMVDFLDEAIRSKLKRGR